MRFATLGFVLAAALGASAGAKEDLQKTWDKGAKALASKQLADGSWSFDGKSGNVAATGLAVMALASTEEGKKTYQAQIEKACANLLANQGANGEIHDAGQVPLLTNYKTSIAVAALAKADSEKHKDAIAKAAKWLREFQYQPGGKQPADPNDPNFGGAGYDEKKSQPRGDLSNTSFMLEALKAAGEPTDSEAWKRAMKFVERCQNRSESNDGPGFDKLGLAVGDDGGFFYRPGESKAEFETLPNGKKIFRSYGSMSYAGLKSMIYAGLAKDDPRVKAVMGWIGAGGESRGGRVGDVLLLPDVRDGPGGVRRGGVRRRGRGEAPVGERAGGEDREPPARGRDVVGRPEVDGGHAAAGELLLPDGAGARGEVREGACRAPSGASRRGPDTPGERGGRT
jgi:squalene-hopene/tetraprenyl-beta-curcumene cyclase